MSGPNNKPSKQPKHPANSLVPAARQVESLAEFDGWMPAIPPEGDYPLPQAFRSPRAFNWNADLPAPCLYSQFARSLAQAGDLYRRPGHADGLLLASECPDIPPIDIVTGPQLARVVADRLFVCVQKGGKTKDGGIPARDLAAMLGAQVFLQHFLQLDIRVSVPMYQPDFELALPGYNDGGRGQRVLYVGPVPEVRRDLDATNKFLDVIAFASVSDRANALAGALTVQMRNLWMGCKPMLFVTSTKSRGGKGTVVEFMRGSADKAAVSYEAADWAFQEASERVLTEKPGLGVLNIDNVRLDKGGLVASTFLERFITEADPLLGTKGRTPAPFPNRVVVAMTANAAQLSTDLMNRSLPIHLAPVGDMAGRTTDIGDPLGEYLPANKARIEAELRGMVEAWKEAGMPRLDQAGHTFSDWARTVGGILQANGVDGFLGNCAERRTMDDPLRNALGLLGVASPDQWRDAAGWLDEAVRQGLLEDLVPRPQRASHESRKRAMAKVLSAHEQETFAVEQSDGVATFRLEARPASEPDSRTKEYRFWKLGWKRSGAGS